MNKKFLKLFVAAISVLLSSWGIYVYGCADGWWGAYNSVFSPEITVNQSSYQPFFYDAENLFYSGDARSAQQQFLVENVQDWKTYLGTFATEDALSYYLYNDTVPEYLDNWRVAVQNNNTSELPYLWDVKDQKVKNFFIFLQIARGTEQITNQTYDYWDYDNRQQLKMEAHKIAAVENLYNKISSTDSFFKNRMWFQLMRLKFYSDNIQSAITFFDQTHKAQPKNTLYYRALHYVAGANKSQGNYQKSNEILAQLFDEFPLLQHAAVFEYRPMTHKEVKISIQKLQPAHQAAFWAIQGYYGDALDAMKEIYAVDPSSKHIDFLLTRYINIIESQVNIYGDSWQPTAMKSVNDFRKKMKKNVDAATFHWVQEVAKEGKVTNPFLWQVASGYLASMQTKFSEATGYYLNAKQYAKTDNQKNQLRLLNLMNEIAKTDKVDKKVEARLLEDLNWLHHELPNTDYSKVEDMRYSYAITWSKQYFSMLYKQQKNDLFAEVVFSKVGFYKNQKQSEAMEQFLLKPNHSAWERLWIDLYEFKLADIYESRGIYLFYQDKMDEALAEFEKITPFERKTYNWEKERDETQLVDYRTIPLPGNPFNGKIKDCNDCEHAARQSIKYSSFDLLKKIKEMKAKIAIGEDVYNNALLVGNAFYNASYFGNARAFYHNSIINEYGNSISKEHEKMLYGMGNVKKYYTLAQNAAETSEQKAKIAYMLAKVERNDFYSNTYFIPNEYYSGYGNNVMIRKWKGFEELKNNYSDTKYYQDVIAECGYFRKYLGLQ